MKTRMLDFGSCIEFQVRKKFLGVLPYWHTMECITDKDIMTIIRRGGN